MKLSPSVVKATTFSVAIVLAASGYVLYQNSGDTYSSMGELNEKMAREATADGSKGPKAGGKLGKEPILEKLGNDPILEKMGNDPILEKMGNDPILEKMGNDPILEKLGNDPILEKLGNDPILDAEEKAL